MKVIFDSKCNSIIIEYKFINIPIQYIYNKAVSSQFMINIFNKKYKISRKKHKRLFKLFVNTPCNKFIVIK
jgi:hypothetical protein